MEQKHFTEITVIDGYLTASPTGVMLKDVLEVTISRKLLLTMKNVSRSHL